MTCTPALIYGIFVVVFAIIMYNHPLSKQSGTHRVSSVVTTLFSGAVWTYFIYYICQRGQNNLAWTLVTLAIVVAALMLALIPRFSPITK